MLRFFVAHILCAQAILFGLCSAVSAQDVNGFAELRYADYSAEEGGKTVDERSHFTQKYSLLWEKTNLIQQGRAGSYTLALGAEWTSVNADINDESVDVDTFKLLYKGDLVFSPGGLPFRLHAYSFDTRPATFNNGSYSNAANISPYLNPGSSILESDIISGFSNGQYVVTGATLLAGIRNGSYMGQYRDILSRYPRLLMDYREVYARDMDAETPVHYRERKLAFVSLNKKDNWFHYRAQDYEDFIDGNGDYEEKTILLGTIDHTLDRKWINLTNWLELSVDGSFTKTIDNYRQGQESDEFAVNLFSVGTRKDWQVSNFSSYRRLREGDDYFSKDLIVPFYAKGDLSPETSWRGQLIGSWEDETRSFTSADRADNSLYARSQFDLLQKSLFIVQPEIAMELRQGDFGEGSGLDLGVQVFSNYRYRPKNPLYGSIHFSALQGDGAEANGIRYVETRLVGRAQRVLRPGLMVGAEQRLLLGDGTLDTSVAPRIRVEGGESLMFSTNDSVNQVREGSILRSTTTLFAEHQSGLLKNRLEAIYDHLSLSENSATSADAGGDMFNLRHQLTYNRPQLKASLNNDFLLGDGHRSRYLSSNYIGSAGANNLENHWSFFSSGELEYYPSRSYEGSVGYQFATNDNSVNQLRLQQRLAYNIFTVNGRVRRLASLYQELLYENYSGIGNDPAVVVLTVGGNYYPGHYISLGARLDQEYYTDGAFGQMTGRLSADFNFPKLIIGLDYAYGVRDAREDYEERTEQRWELKIKKLL